MQSVGNKEQTRLPMSGAKHFWLSFLAVVSGVPIALFVVSIFGFMLLALFIAMLAAAIPSSEPGIPKDLAYGQQTAASTIVALPIRGIILSGTAADPLQSLFGQSYADGELIKEQLFALADDSNVDGIVLEIDSPGGMITASKAIADGVKYVQDANKPIIAHINGTGASGAYWVAATTDAIYAEQGSEAGSIGVIMGPLVTLKGIVSYDSVSTTQPIEFTYFSAGRSKDLGNPFRDMTAEEKAFINQQLSVEYEKFVTHVAEQRDIDKEVIKTSIGALAYGTDDAIAKKLIDGESSKEQAYQTVAKLADAENDYNVLRVNNTTDFFGGLFGVRSLLRELRTSETEKSASRARFCATNLIGRPLVFSGDIQAICK